MAPPSPAQAAVDLCCHGCLSDAAMEGDKKRKRARSFPTRRPAEGPLHHDNSESAHQLTADGTPDDRLRSVTPGKNKGVRGRRPGGHPALTSGEAHIRSEQKNRARSLARSAAQMRNIVSKALDLFRIPVSSSATFAHALSLTTGTHSCQRRPSRHPRSRRRRINDAGMPC